MKGGKMALKIRYDGKWLVRIRINGQDIKVVTSAQAKRRAKEIDAAITAAVRYNNFSMLDEESRAVCVRLFKNRDWPLPPALIHYNGTDNGHKKVTLYKAIQLALETLKKQENGNIYRHEQVFFNHIGPYFGKNCYVQDIWIPEIQEYLVSRVKQGASGSTANKDLAALSKMFSILIENRLVDSNPARMVDPIDEGEGREVCLSCKDFLEIVSHLPEWMRPIIQTLYHTGMRRGEVMGLTLENVNLKKRIIRLRAHQTKESKGKRIPIREELVPILDKAMGDCSTSSDRVFRINGEKAPSEHSLRKPWKKALELTASSTEQPNINLKLLTIHDLRHVWKTNAMRSGMDVEIRKAIMGHSRGISGRYGRISDEDLVLAIDGMDFDKGETEIWI
jgi:integrase